MAAATATTPADAPTCPTVRTCPKVRKAAGKVDAIKARIREIDARIAFTPDPASFAGDIGEGKPVAVDVPNVAALRIERAAAIEALRVAERAYTEARAAAAAAWIEHLTPERVAVLRSLLRAAEAFHDACTAAEAFHDRLVAGCGGVLQAPGAPPTPMTADELERFRRQLGTVIHLRDLADDAA